VQEEQKWFEICQELGGFEHIHYRRRNNNVEKKSGNIRDFLNAWGKRYRYMVVLDADSIMEGHNFISLVKMMEVNPTVGLIQTVPGLIRSESLFGRIQQFSSRLFGPIFVSGLNYWMQEGGNYWGHNAIMRVDPFMAYCDLPHLPGKKPFGGHILSHDFVEAALLRKEDWEVWLAWDLEGSYEEGPQGLIEFAQRDRRWCQGNLQHAALLFAKGFRTISKVHLLLGILGYCASPLWLTFMLIYVWVKFYGKVEHQVTGLSELPPHEAATSLLKHFTMIEHGLLVFGISMGIIFLPKFIAIVELLCNPRRAAKYGGFFRASFSIAVETVFSALHAPILMLFHSWFVVTILLGQGVNWGPQRRAADGTAWVDAFRAHKWHTLIGLVWGGFVWMLDRDSFWWFVPILVGMVLSIPLSVFGSRQSLGFLARKMGLFLTPEETAPPVEISGLEERLQAPENQDAEAGSADDRLTTAITDPYANAIHVSLLREKTLNPVYKKELEEVGVGSDQVLTIRSRLLTSGPSALTNPEKLMLMSDGESMAWLHSRVWTEPADLLAPWWQKALRAYGD
jgi:membrane glycosyltransferase